MTVSTRYIIVSSDYRVGLRFTQPTSTTQAHIVLMHITENRVLAQRKLCIENCSTGHAGAAKAFGAGDEGATANSGAAAQGRSPFALCSKFRQWTKVTKFW